MGVKGSIIEVNILFMQVVANYLNSEEDVGFPRHLQIKTLVLQENNRRTAKTWKWQETAISNIDHMLCVMMKWISLIREILETI